MNLISSVFIATVLSTSAMASDFVTVEEVFRPAFETCEPIPGDTFRSCGVYTYLIKDREGVYISPFYFPQNTTVASRRFQNLP